MHTFLQVEIERRTCYSMRSFFCICISFLIPVAIISIFFKIPPKQELSIGYATKKIEASDFKTDAETFLIFVMASQKLEKQSEEVLKTMAIIDRTWLWYKMSEIDKKLSSPEERKTSITIYLAKVLGLPYVSVKQMKEYSAYYERMRNAVVETSGMAMQKEGNYFIPEYHQIGSRDYLYPGVGSIYYFQNYDKEEVLQYDFPSDCIKIDKWQEGFRVTVLGEGNGKGLSIAKASELANSGWNYRQILYYFFQILV